MTVFVIRHAYAGDRARWRGDRDLDRPLHDVGWEQADEIGRVLAEHPVRALASSPARRCRDTLQPLARKVGVEITIDARLAEGSDPLAVLAALAEAPDFAVLCVH